MDPFGFGNIKTECLLSSHGPNIWETRKTFKTSLRNGRAATWQKRNVCNWTNIDRCLSHIRTSPHRRTYISFLMLIFSPLTLTKTTKNNLVCYDRVFLNNFFFLFKSCQKKSLSVFYIECSGEDGKKATSST